MSGDMGWPDQPASSAAVLGELVIDEAPSRSARVGRTGVQVSVPAAVLVVVTWWASLVSWDLDPGPGTDMPAEVVAAWVLLLTVAMAKSMNRKPKDPSE